jgi:hypothetical protein
MSKHPNDIQARARTLAQSGKFAGWKAVAFELRFEPGYEDGAEWLFSPAAKEEIDSLCQVARAKRPNAA